MTGSTVWSAPQERVRGGGRGEEGDASPVVTGCPSALDSGSKAHRRIPRITVHARYVVVAVSAYGLEGAGWGCDAGPTPSGTGMVMVMVMVMVIVGR